MSAKIILLFSLALVKTYVFKISFARIPHAICVHTGPDISHFVVFFSVELLFTFSCNLAAVLYRAV